jgi:hypothetical protein
MVKNTQYQQHNQKYHKQKPIQNARNHFKLAQNPIPLEQPKQSPKTHNTVCARLNTPNAIAKTL